MSELLTVGHIASRIASESCNVLHSMATQFTPGAVPHVAILTAKELHGITHYQSASP